MSGQHLHGQDRRQHHQLATTRPQQESFGHPQRRRQPGATQDRPLEHDSGREPPVDVDQSGQPPSHVAQAQLSRKPPGEQERQQVMSQLHRVVRGADIQHRIQHVERVEQPCLTLTHYRVTVSHPVVPQWHLSGSQTLGQVRLLRKEIGVDVPAQQPATGIQRPPEDQRQAQPDQDGHQPAVPRDDNRDEIGRTRRGRSLGQIDCRRIGHGT
ncbi:MAG: hypothetical protein CM1200mP2_55910 [Planctomycetaceae bacterium]|nr:MAG: hypothetical protein CM1200mP2_55910 [Planctomycetaceae bacterium]